MAKAEVFPMYSKEGTRCMLDLEPISYEDWSVGDPLTDERCALHDTIQALVPRTIQSTRLRALSINITLELIFTDGSRAIVRAPVKYDPWSQRKFEAEKTILKWLDGNTTIPVPSIIASDERSAVTINSLLDGLDAAHAYPSFASNSLKDASVTSYADIFIRAFRLNVPERFGSAEGSESALRAGSFLSVSEHRSIELRGDEDLTMFFSLLIERMRARSAQDHNSTLVSRRLSEMFQGLQPLINEVTCHEFMMRFTLHHQDLRPNNILLDPKSGMVTGVIDWEYHAFLPAVLTANYPSWLLYSGRFDPKFNNTKSKFHTYWLDTPDESARLRKLFEESVKSLDNEYFMCLIDPAGIKLRDALDWLIMNDAQLDPDYDGMAAWVEAELYGEL